MLKRLKNILLFFGSPFIALAYLFALPFVGMYMVINLSIERMTMPKTEVHDKHTTLHA